MARYQEILHQHEQVMHAVDRLDLLLGAPMKKLSEDRVRQIIIADVWSLHDDLAKHFEFEEEGGYLELVTNKRPGLSKSVEALQAQHQQVLDKLTKVLDADSKTELAELALELAEAIDLLREHEAAENELVLAAVNEDIAAGD
jgi:hypothetical protein